MSWPVRKSLLIFVYICNNICLFPQAQNLRVHGSKSISVNINNSISVTISIRVIVIIIPINIIISIYIYIYTHTHIYIYIYTQLLRLCSAFELQYNECTHNTMKLIIMHYYYQRVFGFTYTRKSIQQQRKGRRIQWCDWSGLHYIFCLGLDCCMITCTIISCLHDNAYSGWHSLHDNVCRSLDFAW